MKKDYINPEMEVVRLTMNHYLLSGSPNADIDGDESVDANLIEASQFFDNGDSNESW